jgi:hypothetical protein
MLKSGQTPVRIFTPVELSKPQENLEVQEYYPCEDPNNPVCRYFVNQNKCKKDKKCRFYHPPIITPIIRKEATREIGKCYCGANQKHVVNKKNYSPTEDINTPTFFVLCGRTGRSMKLCI